jgi:hypothetical protein
VSSSRSSVRSVPWPSSVPTSLEVAPAYRSRAQVTAVAASHVAYEILSAMTPR